MKTSQWRLFSMPKRLVIASIRASTLHIDSDAIEYRELLRTLVCALQQGIPDLRKMLLLLIGDRAASLARVSRETTASPVHDSK